MSATTILPLQPFLPQALPAIQGNLDYRLLREQFLRIDDLLTRSGLETQLLAEDLQAWCPKHPRASARALHHHQLHAQRALRCNLAQVLLAEDFRGFAARLADSPLLQRFCCLDDLGRVKVPAKSTLQRYFVWWNESQVRRLSGQLLAQGASTPAQLNLSQPVDLDTVFLDTTCLVANIHYPVDWVLLRDATRTLMKAIHLIRDQGLKHRMEAPETFGRRINALCIAMTHAWNKDDSQRQRKRTLRQMDRVVAVVRQHATRYRERLDASWAETEWTRPQAEQVLARMDQVLQQLPKARQQARRRILQGQLVPNDEKILSLYEADVRVIVRKKPGAEVEFGNTLLLAENRQGLIVDWELFRESAPADAQLLPRTVGRMEAVFGRGPKALAADRGFDNFTNRVGLSEDGIYNGVCPRSPERLAERSRSAKFKGLQRRRAQTEGRIGILKNVFLGETVRSKGFERRALTVTWAVLVHNLWVLARQPQLAVAQAA
jgi:hypothetical protein